MRILADENVASAVVAGLRASGFDVLSVKESMKSSSDAAILERAKAEDRVLVTHDKDFGELAFRARLPAQSGVVLFRLSGADPETDNRRMLSVLQSRDDWSGRFSVVTEDRIRMRLRPHVASEDS